PRRQAPGQRLRRQHDPFLGHENLPARRRTGRPQCLCPSNRLQPRWHAPCIGIGRSDGAHLGFTLGAGAGAAASEASSVHAIGYYSWSEGPEDWQKSVEPRQAIALPKPTLGFKVAMLSARVMNAAGGLSPEFDHMTLLVQLDKGWLADVGFGD